MSQRPIQSLHCCPAIARWVWIGRIALPQKPVGGASPFFCVACTPEERGGPAGPYVHRDTSLVVAQNFRSLRSSAAVLPMPEAGPGHCLYTLLWLRAVPDTVLDASPAAGYRKK